MSKKAGRGSWMAFDFARYFTLFSALSAAPAAGQLRPLSPIEWSAFDRVQTVSIGLGVGMLANQAASLAGTTGDMLEIGTFHVVWTSGRFGVDAEGTLYRRFRDEEVVRPPIPGTDPATGALRTDAGDIVATTLIRLTPDSSTFTAALRFGTRLPTTSNEPGLERDRTDFFASAGGRYRWRRLALGAEAGVGILGTRIASLDQLDVLTFAAVAEYRLGGVTAVGAVVGHDDLHRGLVRGSEDLSEVRLGVRAGQNVWVSVTAVRGIAEFSPGAGLFLMAGIQR